MSTPCEARECFRPRTTRYDEPAPICWVARPVEIWRSAALERPATGPGTELVVQVSNFPLFGRVVWSEGERCGVRFDEDIDALDVEFLHKEIAAAGRQLASSARG